MTGRENWDTTVTAELKHIQNQVAKRRTHRTKQLQNSVDWVQANLEETQKVGQR